MIVSDALRILLYNTSLAILIVTKLHSTALSFFLYCLMSTEYLIESRTCHIRIHTDYPQYISSLYHVNCQHKYWAVCYVSDDMKNDNTISIVTRLWARLPVNHGSISDGKDIYLFPEISRHAQVPTKFPI
jgi:hypothetical protein